MIKLTNTVVKAEYKSIRTSPVPSHAEPAACRSHVMLYFWREIQFVIINWRAPPKRLREYSMLPIGQDGTARQDQRG